VHGVLLRQEEDEGFLFDPDSGQIKLLNSTGVEVWSLLDGRRDTAALAAALVAAHPEADAPLVAGDVDRFVDALVAAGFAEVVVGDR
jgi:hypothetical protein